MRRGLSRGPTDGSGTVIVSPLAMGGKVQAHDLGLFVDTQRKDGAAHNDQYNPKPWFTGTSRAGLPSRSTGKRLRCRARSCDFRFAPSYLVIVMRSICVGDICYVFTAAYISRSDYARHVMLLFDFDVQWKEMLISTRYPAQNYGT